MATPHSTQPIDGSQSNNVDERDAILLEQVAKLRTFFVSGSKFG